MLHGRLLRGRRRRRRGFVVCVCGGGRRLAGLKMIRLATYVEVTV